MSPLPLALTRLTVAAALVVAATGACGPADPDRTSPTGGTPLTGTASPGDASGSPAPTQDESVSSSERVEGRATDRTRTLTPADDGTTVHLRVGEVVELHVADSFAPEPDVQGDAIEVVETVSATGSSGREFEVRAVRAGDATLAGESDGTTFSIRFRVEA